MRETPAGVRGRGDPAGAKRRGGSPARPRKAKRMERKSTDKFNTAKKQNLGVKENEKRAAYKFAIRRRIK